MLWRSRVPHPNPLDTKKYLNFYHFRPGRPLVWREGRPAIDALEFLLASVDFTFVRHIAASYYRMRNWQPIHDPPFLYAIHLWKTVEGLHHEQTIDILRDRRRGREGRELLGLALDEIPKTYTVLTRFLERLGDDGLFSISRAFLWLLAETGFVLGETSLAIDGQLVPTYSRYHGCNASRPGCANLSLPPTALKEAVLATLAKLAPTWRALAATGIASQRHRVSTPCHFGVMASGGKRVLDVPLAWLRVFPKHETGYGPDETARLGIDVPWLSEQGLGIRLEAESYEQGKDGFCSLSCPRLPSDTTARIGWKNSNQPDGKPKPVFGVDLEQVTLRIPELGLELPIGGLGSPGNAPTRLRELLELFRDTGNRIRPAWAALDARYDALDFYALLTGSVDTTRERPPSVSTVISPCRHRCRSCALACAAFERLQPTLPWPTTPCSGTASSLSSPTSPTSMSSSAAFSPPSTRLSSCTA